MDAPSVPDACQVGIVWDVAESRWCLMAWWRCPDIGRRVECLWLDGITELSIL